MFLVLFIQQNIEALHKNTLPMFYIQLIRFLKFVSSNVGVIVFGIILTFSQIGMFSLMLLLFNFETSWRISVRYMNLFVFSNFCLILLLTIVDFVLNLNDFFCHCKKFWIKKDPFRFRIQQVSLFFVAPPILAFLIFNITELQNENSAISCITQDASGFQIVTSTIMRAAIIFYYSGFILFYTLFSRLSMLFSKRQNVSTVKLDSMDEIFYDEDEFALFNEFIKSEFSSENVYLFQDIKKYEQMFNGEERKAFANEIFEKYLSGKFSALEANIPGSVIRKVQRLMENDSFDDNLFNSVLSCVKENLTDSYSRFIITQKYLNYQSKKNLIDENVSLFVEYKKE
jgi:hypothetical protein